MEFWKDASLRNMMFAWKIEMCLENTLEKDFLENHWISLKIRNCIGKWSLKWKWILRKTWTLRKSFLRFGLLFWENRFLKNGFENSEKTNFISNSRTLGKSILNLKMKLRMLKYWEIMIWTWEILEISFENSEFLRKSNPEKDLENFEKIDFSEMELGNEFENDANWMNEYEFERYFLWGIEKSFWKILRNAVHFWS